MLRRAFGGRYQSPSARMPALRGHSMSSHDHSARTSPVQSGTQPQQPHGAEGRPHGFWTSKAGLATIAFLLIAAFLILSEHRAHALGYLPFLLLLACPLLHMFMHGGHSGHGGHGSDSKRSTSGE